MNPSTPGGTRLGRVAWLICIIASIGFAFDIYELLMLPLIVRPALQELIGAAPGTPDFQMWVGRLFYIPAVAGGIFGLLGGYLTDRLGRRRVLTWSILIYAFSAFAAGFATSVWMLLVCRCFVFIGVCVEFVAAVAWLAELFPDPKQREKVLGYTQAFSSIGGFLVASANSWCIAHSASLPAIDLPQFLNFFGGDVKDAHAAWRFTLMSGCHPGDPAHPDPAFLARVPDLGGTQSRRHPQAAEHRPAFLARAAPHHNRDDPDVRRRVRCCVRRHSADSWHRPGTVGRESQGRCRGCCGREGQARG